MQDRRLYTFRSRVMGVGLIVVMGLAGAAQAGYTGQVLGTLQAPYAGEPNYYYGPNSSFPESIAIGGQSAGLAYVYSNGSTTGAVNAEMWDADGTAHNLTPSGIMPTPANSQLTGTNGTYQVGYATTNSGVTHAVVWNGTGASAVDIHPTNLSIPTMTGSQAYAVNNNQITGSVSTSVNNPQIGQSQQLAVLWNKSGSNWVATDLSAALSSTTYNYSVAQNTDGTTQVGYAINSTNNNWDPIKWTNSGSTATKLSTSGAGAAGLNIFRPYAVSGTEIVGFGQNGVNGYSTSQALVWDGNNDPVNLTPSGLTRGMTTIAITGAQAYATNGSVQVGYGVDSHGNDYALLWTGSAASTVDLDALLPAGYSGSIASAIDSSGNVFGFASDSSNNTVTVEWSPTPEPGSLGLVAVAAVGLLARRRRQRHA